MMEEIDETVFAEGNDGSLLQEKHISIQKSLSQLESFVDRSHGEKKTPCPLCGEIWFRPCDTDKVLDHLLNWHWNVSVECQGYRMCVCFLPCNENTAENEDQGRAKNELQQISSQPKVRGKTKDYAHYHCIFCSATVVGKKVKMLAHIKQHFGKAETKANPSTAIPQEILQESNSDVQVLPNSCKPKEPKKSRKPFVPVKKTAREKKKQKLSWVYKVREQLCCSAVAVLTEERKLLECLDVVNSRDNMGLQWKKHLGNSVKVILSGISDKATAAVRENCHVNQMKVIMRGEEKSEDVPENEDMEDFVNTVEVTQMDANILMHTQSFDFIHLAPVGTSVHYLDAAFRSIRNLGIIAVTSYDTGSLYAKTVDVTKRHYGCNIISTEYFKELGARIVLAAVARAAARCDKGLEVLLSVALENCVLVIVRVLSGPMLADESMKMIKNVIHCQSCQERIFQKEGNMLEEHQFQQLPCDCHESMPGTSAVLLGPVWSGPIFDSGFLKRMRCDAECRGMMESHLLLKTLILESECTPVQEFAVQSSRYSQEDGVFIKIPETDALPKPGKRKRDNKNTQVPKRPKTDYKAVQFPFYYRINAHASDKFHQSIVKKMLRYMSEAGFQGSRTHFNSTGIRTNASLATFKAILEKHISLSDTSQASSCKETPETLQEEEEPQPAEISSDSDAN